MKVEVLNIERRQSYDTDYPNMLVGIVQMKGAHGKIETKLSNETVSKIFQLVKKDVQQAAKYNAEQVNHAIDEAKNEPLLIAEMA